MAIIVKTTTGLTIGLRKNLDKCWKWRELEITLTNSTEAPVDGDLADINPKIPKQQLSGYSKNCVGVVWG
jgi:hypothetical protein